MKKSVKATMLVMLVVIMFLLSSCKGGIPGGDKPSDTAAAARALQTGTQGVQIQLLNNLPPNTVYDQTELVALVEVKNKGNYDLGPQECFVQITGFDTNIIHGGMNIPQSCAEGVNILEGKTLYNSEGTFNQLEFSSSSIRLPEGVFEYSPTLNFLTCYNYHTRANPAICVDPLFYQVTAQQKTCTPSNVALGGGQGAPVGVSSIGVDMVGNKAVFEINVANQGNGRVISPYADIRNCGQASLHYTDLDKIFYTVDLSGGSLVNCKPSDGAVRLVNGKGKIVCSFNIPGTSAYETPLMIDLDYGYVQSQSKRISIIKTPE
jgi:hypothetical protein